MPKSARATQHEKPPANVRVPLDQAGKTGVVCPAHDVAISSPISDRRVSAQKTHLGNRRPATGRKNGRNAAARKAPQSVRPSSLPGRCPHVGCSPLTSSLHATLSNTPHRDRTGIIQLLSSALQAKIDIYKKNFSHHSGLPFYCLKSKMTKTYLPFY